MLLLNVSSTFRTIAILSEYKKVLFSYSISVFLWLLQACLRHVSYYEKKKQYLTKVVSFYRCVLLHIISKPYITCKESVLRWAPGSMAGVRFPAGHRFFFTPQPPRPTQPPVLPKSLITESGETSIARQRPRRLNAATRK
jgi:hypothetical protein